MNPTERYVKMCEKAEEIQKAWKPKVGDWILRKYDIFGKEIDTEIWGEDKLQEIVIIHRKSSIGGYYMLVNEDGEERIFNSKKEYYKTTSIWLPTQEQLQEMCNPPLDVLLQEFWQWIPKYEVGVKYASMNELWLAFVMWTKYHKIWDDEKEEWVEIKTVHNPVTESDYPVKEAKNPTEQKEGLWGYKKGGK